MNTLVDVSPSRRLADRQTKYRVSTCLCPTVYTGRSEVVLEGSLEEISTFVGKIRATKDTLTVDYSVLPVDDFGPLADMD